MSSVMADERQALTPRPISKPASAGPVASMTSSSVISSRHNYSSSSVSFPPNRSPPKGPRPAPSAYQTRIEPARIPLPVDDVENSLLLGSISLGHYAPNVTASSSDVPATASLVEATSTSPPPFARNLANSISSSTSQHSPPSLYSNDNEVHGITPDPWAPHATNANTIGLSPQAPTVIDPPKPNPVVMADEMESLIAGLDALGLVNETSDRNASPPRFEAKSGPNLISSGISFQINDAISPLSDNSTGKTRPASGTLVSTHRSLQIPSPAVPAASNTDLSPIATSDNLSPNSLQSSSISKSLVGSFDPSGSILSESVSWEKVEDINDEWQELSNPHEDVLEVSESEDSDHDQGLEDDEADVDEEDEAEWEASRKVHPASMADSCFVPSVERRRRAAAAATENNGSATPRGKRTPTTSFAKAGGVRSGASCAYEATSTYSNPRSGPASATQPKLTPQQEQLVAELQKARTTKTIGIPAHQMMSRRRAIPLSQDW